TVPLAASDRPASKGPRWAVTERMEPDRTTPPPPPPRSHAPSWLALPSPPPASPSPPPAPPSPPPPQITAPPAVPPAPSGPPALVRRAGARMPRWLELVVVAGGSVCATLIGVRLVGPRAPAEAAAPPVVTSACVAAAPAAPLVPPAETVATVVTAAPATSAKV